MKKMERKPIVHCITNIVTVNDCANVLHAIGAAPVMAHHPLEVAQVTASADALVINLGATESYDAMKIAIEAAAQNGKPIVIDPVGTGGIDYRREMFKELTDIAKPTCVRGNVSEIKALLYDQVTTSGVDANLSQCDIKQKDLDDIVKEAAIKLGCIVVASGAIDVISDGINCYHIEAGTEMLTRITGAGCMSSVMLGAYFGDIINPDKDAYLKAVIDACTHMAKCGEIAAEKTKQNNAGIMTFHNLLIDEISLY